MHPVPVVSPFILQKTRMNFLATYFLSFGHLCSNMAYDLQWYILPPNIFPSPFCCSSFVFWKIPCLQHSRKIQMNIRKIFPRLNTESHRENLMGFLGGRGRMHCFFFCLKSQWCASKINITQEWKKEGDGLYKPQFSMIQCSPIKMRSYLRIIHGCLGRIKIGPICKTQIHGLHTAKAKMDKDSEIFSGMLP